MTTSLLERDRAALIVIDVQEAFRRGIDRFDKVVANSAILVQAARILDMPVVVTEQYPAGLGDTVGELKAHLDGVERLPKTVFSAARAEGFELAGRDQALVCGIEAHVCVNQTVHDMVSAGVVVHVATDAVSSRSLANRAVGLARMERDGAVLSSTETALFELLGQAGTDEFKAIQQLVK
jgi:nicotinamidase-related amidase